MADASNPSNRELIVNPGSYLAMLHNLALQAQTFFAQMSPLPISIAIETIDNVTPAIDRIVATASSKKVQLPVGQQALPVQSPLSRELGEWQGKLAPLAGRVKQAVADFTEKFEEAALRSGGRGHLAELHEKLYGLGKERSELQRRLDQETDPGKKATLKKRLDGVNQEISRNTAELKTAESPALQARIDQLRKQTEAEQLRIVADRMAEDGNNPASIRAKRDADIAELHVRQDARIAKIKDPDEQSAARNKLAADVELRNASADGQIARFDQRTKDIDERATELNFKARGLPKHAQLAHIQYDIGKQLREAGGDPARERAVKAEGMAEVKELMKGRTEVGFSNPLSSWHKMQQGGESIKQAAEMFMKTLETAPVMIPVGHGV